MSAPADRDCYAVVGNPVAHSLSPRIHALFAAETGQNLGYEAIEIDTEDFESGLRDLQQQGYRGVNVTVPFKRWAFQLCDQLSPRARDAGAVNTLVFQPDGGIAGDNTDGVGLTRDLVDNLQVLISHRKILILGAGGAVRGVLGPILAQNPRQLTLANRTLENAEALAGDFKSFGPIQVSEFGSLEGEHFDLIINGTAAGLSNEVPPISDSVLDVNSVCYDMMYNLSAPTAFVDWALSRGAVNAHDGLGMLVEQAAEAFFLWRGLRPDSTAVIAALRGHQPD